MDNEQVVKDITELKGSMKTAFNKLREHDDEIKEIRAENKVLHEMSANIKLLANNSENLKEEITTVKTDLKELKEKPNPDIVELKCDVRELKEKPAKRWDALTLSIITLLTGGVIGFILEKVLGG
jgi:uncharacterized coiled-coil DUF342 family protein